MQKFVEDGGLVERVNRGAKGTFFKILSKKKEDGTYDEVKDYVSEIPNMLPAIDEAAQKMFKFGSSSYDENGELTMNILDDEDIEVPTEVTEAEE